jgi:hypothetical protein
MALTVKIWNQSSAYVALEPQWSLKDDIDKDWNLNRTPSGAATLYTYATWKNWDMNFRYIPTSAAVFVNSIYGSTRQCQLELIEDGVSAVYSVMMLNDKSPFQKLEEPLTDRLEGSLALSVY